MQRRFAFTLLVASVLLPVTLQAQRGGGAFAGGAVRGGVISSGFGGHSQFGFRSGFFPGHRFRSPGNTILAFPFWWGDTFTYEEPVAPPPAPTVIVVGREPVQSPPPERAAASPHIIEVPSAAGSVSSKPLPPAIFILKSGERLELRRYMLTHQTLYFSVDRQQRALPLALLDLEATVAANHTRGLELRIPADPSEISLGF